MLPASRHMLAVPVVPSKVVADLAAVLAVEVRQEQAVLVALVRLVMVVPVALAVLVMVVTVVPVVPVAHRSLLFPVTAGL